MLVREGIISLLSSQNDFVIVGASSDGQAALDGASKYDVLVTDIRMPPRYDREGIELAKHLRSTAPHVGVVVLSQYGNAEYALALLEDGSQGRAYLLKESLVRPSQLYEAVRAVHRKESVVDPAVVDALVGNRLARDDSPILRLTPRELEVLEEMAEGHTNGRIAGRLGLSPGSVEKHVNAIFMKLDLPPHADTHRRVRAVLLYLADVT